MPCFGAIDELLQIKGEVCHVLIIFIKNEQLPVNYREFYNNLVENYFMNVASLGYK